MRSANNEHAFDRKSKELIKAIGLAAGVVLFFGLLLGACVGCRYVVVDTGRAIIQP